MSVFVLVTGLTLYKRATCLTLDVCCVHICVACFNAGWQVVRQKLTLHFLCELISWWRLPGPRGHDFLITTARNLDQALFSLWSCYNKYHDVKVDNQGKIHENHNADGMWYFCKSEAGACIPKISYWNTCDFTDLWDIILADDQRGYWDGMTGGSETFRLSRLSLIHLGILLQGKVNGLN